MSDVIACQSALAAYSKPFRLYDTVIDECSEFFQYTLRGDPNDPFLCKAVEKVLGIGLPSQPNTITQLDHVTLLWMGPAEWLILSTTQAFVAPLLSALKGTHHNMTDVTQGQTIITLSGLHALDVLATGCSLDLHESVLKVNDCAQTYLAKAMVLLYKTNNAPAFYIIVRRSFADYLWRWLVDALQARQAA